METWLKTERTPRTQRSGWLWRHWNMFSVKFCRQGNGQPGKQTWKEGLSWLWEDQTFQRTLSSRPGLGTAHRKKTCSMTLHRSNICFFKASRSNTRPWGIWNMHNMWSQRCWDCISFFSLCAPEGWKGLHTWRISKKHERQGGKKKNQTVQSVFSSFKSFKWRLAAADSSHQTFWRFRLF